LKYYIVAGEPSGDLHASNLIREIKKKDPAFQCRAWGGDLMQAEGAELVKHIRDLAFMGFVEVIANLKTILGNIVLCKKDILDYKPDALILVDYPGFNLRIAQFAKKAGFKVYYYISPQVWAWKQSRVHTIKKSVDKMIVILPFEKAFYKKFGFDVTFTGHPLLDVIERRKNNINLKWKEEHGTANKKIIALLPGSRKQEIATMLPLMLSIRKHFPSFEFIVGAAPGIDAAYYKDLIKEEEVRLVYNDTYSLLENSFAALVTSGTATLETALFGIPEVVCYKGNKLSYRIARSLVKIKYISLANLIMDKEVVKELIQDELTSGNLKTELKKLTTDEYYRNKMKEELIKLREMLGGTGASERAASEIISDLNK
jgi:lipid-A-disaccharide synthase